MGYVIGETVFFKKIRITAAATRLLDEELYEQVANELANGQRRDGLWVKALANSAGIEGKAKALYIQYRIQSIKDEIELTLAIEENLEKHINSELVSELPSKGKKNNEANENSPERKDDSVESFWRKYEAEKDTPSKIMRVSSDLYNDVYKEKSTDYDVVESTTSTFSGIITAVAIVVGCLLVFGILPLVLFFKFFIDP